MNNISKSRAILFVFAVAFLIIGFLGGFIWGNKKAEQTFTQFSLLNSPQGIPLSLVALLSSNPAVLDFRADVEIAGTIQELKDNKLVVAVKNGEPIEIMTDNLTAFLNTTDNTPPSTIPIFSSKDVKVGEQVIVSATVDEGALKARLVRPYIQTQ